MKPIQQPLTLFLIGATGDLAKKKILRALYGLHKEGLLPERFRLIGNSRKKLTDAEFQKFIYEVVKPEDAAQWQSFAKTVHYVSGDIDEIETFHDIRKLHESYKTCGNHLWYIATLPSLYIQTVRNMKSTGFDHTTCGWTKIMLEKPFGTNVETAHELDLA